MHDTQQAARQQDYRIQNSVAGCNSFQFSDLLTAIYCSIMWNHSYINIESVNPKTETLSMILSQVMSSDRSCQHVVNQAAIARLEGSLGLMSLKTLGYCRERKRLPTEMIESLTRYIASAVHVQS